MRRRDFLKVTAVAAGYAILREWPGRADAIPFPVYLTFDDGPTTFRDLTGPTTNVLDILKAEKIPATFFLHGRAINHWEGPVISRMIAEGHSVGNHLWQQGGNTVKDHPKLPFMAKQYILTEWRIRNILKTTDANAFARYMGQPKLFRRPGGSNHLNGFLDANEFDVLRSSPFLRLYKDKLDWLSGVYDYSGWHVNGGDGITNLKIQPDTVAKMVPWIIKGGFGYYGVDDYLCAGTPGRRSFEAEGGLIILLHDADKVTDDSLPSIILELRARGAEFRALPRPQDRPNTRTVGIAYPPTADPNGIQCSAN